MPTRQLTIEPLTGSIGAVVGGLDLTVPLPDDVVATVRALHGSERLREMRRTGRALVDGRGAERVVAALERLR